MNRATPAHPKRLDERSVVARIKRIRLRRTRIKAAGCIGLPLFVFVLLVAVVALLLPVAYACFGTSVPFVVSPPWESGPPSPGSRIRAGIIGLGCWTAIVAVVWRPLARVLAFRGPHRFASRRVAIDPSGVWLASRGSVADGLAFSEITAVSVVEEWQRTTVPPEHATPPLLELFPVSEATAAPTLLGSLVVNAAPPVPGVRGKRYVIPLDGEPVEVRALIAALDGFAPGKRVG